MFDHLPVDAGFVRTESAGNARLRVSGQDVTPGIERISYREPLYHTDTASGLWMPQLVLHGIRELT